LHAAAGEIEIFDVQRQVAVAVALAETVADLALERRRLDGEPRPRGARPLEQRRELGPIYR
jgi:hypothetical protein